MTNQDVDKLAHENATDDTMAPFSFTSSTKFDIDASIEYRCTHGQEFDDHDNTTDTYPTKTYTCTHTGDWDTGIAVESSASLHNCSCKTKRFYAFGTLKLFVFLFKGIGCPYPLTPPAARHLSIAPVTVGDIQGWNAPEIVEFDDYVSYVCDNMRR